MSLAIQDTKKDITKEHDLSLIEQVVMQGDLSKLSSVQRVTYYHKVCDSIGLNPYTRPFDYISLNGKLQLYAKKDATEQLRSVKNISIAGLEGRVVDDLYIVKAKATMPNGRTDESTGAVTIGNLKGDAKANAIMKAETKAKRRVTLSISGLGWVDESELESIPNAKRVDVNMETGEIIDIPSNQARENSHSNRENSQKMAEITYKNIQKSQASPENVEQTSKIPPENPDLTIADPFIDEEQYKLISEKVLGTESIFQTNMKKHLNITEYHQVRQSQYPLVIRWINLNLEKVKKDAEAHGEIDA